MLCGHDNKMGMSNNGLLKSAFICNSKNIGHDDKMMMSNNVLKHIKVKRPSSTQKPLGEDEP